jgi:UMF1 family MFS transporter
VTYGLVTWLSGGDHRLAILLTGTYFVAGIAILVRIDVERGRNVALKAQETPARSVQNL